MSGYAEKVDPSDGTTRNLSGSKRLLRPEAQNRRKERNRMHARKTRERKKAESLALQQRIEELTDEGKFLRHMAMDRHTASVLVALTSQTASAAASGNLLANAEVMEGRVHTVALPAHLSKYATSTVNPLSPHPSAAPQEKVKRSRSRQECSPQEGLRLRRERNRLHAKRTRDRKRFAQEESERIIQDMEAETLALRQYLVSINLLSAEDMAKSIERDSTSRKMLAQLKVVRAETKAQDEDGDDDNEDMDEEIDGEEMRYNGDGDDEQSGCSDDGLWGGSTDEHSKALSVLVKGGNPKKKASHDTSSTNSSASNSNGMTTGASGLSGSSSESAAGSSRGGSVDGEKSRTKSSRSGSNIGSMQSSCSNSSSGGDSPSPEGENDVRFEGSSSKSRQREVDGYTSLSQRKGARGQDNVCVPYSAHDSTSTAASILLQFAR